jgi:hypothetical protein
MYPLEEHKDVWVENEFWDFCSGRSNTWQLINQAFLELGENAKFIEKYRKRFYD